ncbi:MAG: hypothetical protein ACREXP_07560 [Steroidobacteraceae bacterium]
MIDVEAVVGEVPHFETFCSVAKVHGLVQQLQADPRFAVSVAGTSVNGLPIHHVRFGTGAVKALLVAFPHCKEPICGLTVFSLMTLLQRGNPTLIDADVEWHIVPCIDPDGALLNEGWTQKPVTMKNYMKNFYVQALRDQVDTSFPIAHKRLVWRVPSQEARILQQLLAQIRPDFFYSLHNAWTGGAFYFLSRDVDHKYHGELYRFLQRQDFPLQKRPLWRGVCEQFGEGIIETWSIRKHYDYLEKTTSSPEEFLPFGAGSWDYLEEINPRALTLIAETGYVRHPGDESERDTGQNLRQFKLRIDADSKYLGALLLQEWENVKGDVDSTSPLYRAIVGGGVLPAKDRLHEGGRPMSMQPTRDVLFHPQYDRTMKEGDRFQACMVDGGFWFLCHSYQFVRLLRTSRKTPAVERAIERLERAFEEALAGIEQYVDFDAFEVFDCDTLAKVQLGSGLIVLNSILEQRAGQPVAGGRSPAVIS